MTNVSAKKFKVIIQVQLENDDIRERSFYIEDIIEQALRQRNPDIASKIKRWRVRTLTYDEPNE